YNSIYYRILFYKKIIDNNSLVKQYSADIKKGIYTLIRIFLYSRINEFPALYNDFVKLIKMAGIFSNYEVRKLQFLIKFGNSNSLQSRTLKLKGIFYRLLPGK